MISQLLKDIKNRIENQLANSSNVVIDESVISLVNTEILFEKVFADASLTLIEAVITENVDSLSISGKCAIFSTALAPLTITFVDSSQLNLKLTGTLENQIQLSKITGQLFNSFTLLPNQLTALNFDSFTLEIVPANQTVNFTVTDQTTLDIGASFFSLENPTLLLSSSSVSHQYPEVDIRLQGTLLIANKRFHGYGQYSTDVVRQIPFTISPIDEKLTISNLVQEFLGLSIQQLPNLAFSEPNLMIDIDSGDFNFEGTLEDWNLDFNIASIKFNSLTADFRGENGDLSGGIQGKTNIADAEAIIQGKLEENLVISGTIGQIDLINLLTYFRGTVSIPGDFPKIQLPSGNFLIDLNPDNLIFIINSSLENFGTLTAVVKKVADTWGYIVGFKLPSNWKLSNLLSILEPLDNLKISPPQLFLSTFEDQEFQFPALPNIDPFPEIKQGVIKGVVLISSLDLEGFGLDFIAKLVQKDELPLLLEIEDNINESKIVSNLGGTIEIIPGIITFEKFSLIIAPSPFSIAFNCIAQVIIFDEVLPRFSAAIVLAETQEKIVFETEEKWINPFGVTGLTINELILDIEMLPEQKFGVLGDISINDKRIRVAAQITDGVPSGLVGELIGKLSLSEIVKDLVGLTLPPIIDISISDFKIYIVADPLGMTIGSEHFAPGLALQGVFETFGIGMFVQIKISLDNGVFAKGTLKEKIQIGSIFAVSNATGDGPPEMQIDSANSPYLLITGMVNLLGLTQSINASLDDSGFEVQIIENLGISSYALKCNVISLSHFYAEGTFSFGLKADIGPIQLGAGGPDLGTIKLDTGFDGSLSLSLVEEVFSAKIDGSFSFAGINFSIPSINLSVSPDSIEEIPERVTQQIIDNAKDIFEMLYNDAGKWIEAIGKGLIAIAEDVAKKAEQVAQALSKQFNQSAEEIGIAIRDTLNLGSQAAAEGLKSIGETPEKIADILKNLGDSNNDVQVVIKILFPLSIIPNIEVPPIPPIPPIPYVDIPTPYVDIPTPYVDIPTPYIDLDPF